MGCGSSNNSIDNPQNDNDDDDIGKNRVNKNNENQQSDKNKKLLSANGNLLNKKDKQLDYLQLCWCSALVKYSLLDRKWCSKLLFHRSFRNQLHIV